MNKMLCVKKYGVSELKNCIATGHCNLQLKLSTPVSKHKKKVSDNIGFMVIWTFS